MIETIWPMFLQDKALLKNKLLFNKEKVKKQTKVTSKMMMNFGSKIELI